MYVDAHQIVSGCIGDEHVPARQERQTVRIRLCRIRRLVEVVGIRVGHLVRADVGHQLDFAVWRDAHETRCR